MSTTEALKALNRAVPGSMIVRGFPAYLRVTEWANVEYRGGVFVLVTPTFRGGQWVGDENVLGTFDVAVSVLGGAA